ncbi:MAG: hypothetical protein IBJ11_08890 [Phycisphaerales bacterium]|nr:hypothetical protein [Phycisphaerales bacterium]
MPLSFLKPSPSPIAVDFGTASLKLLQVEPGPSKEAPPTLVAAAALDTPDELIDKDNERLAWQVDSLPALMKQAGFKGRRAVCSVSASHAFVQHVQVQKIEGMPVLPLLAEQLRGFTGRDPTQLILRHIEVGEVVRSGNKLTEILTIAIPREVVFAYMKALKGCKLDPVGVHCEHMALLRTFDSITRRETDVNLTSLYVDLGYGYTKVVMAHGREAVLAKTITLGGKHLDLAIAQATGLGRADARLRRCMKAEARAEARRPIGAPAPAGGALPPNASFGGAGLAAAARDAEKAAIAAEERRVGATPAGHCELPSEAFPEPAAAPTAAAAREAMDTLTEEVAMTLRYYQALFPQRKVDRAIFVGGESRQIDVCRHIAKSLRLPAQVADPVSRLGRSQNASFQNLDLAQSQPGWAVPLGLCLSPTEL